MHKTLTGALGGGKVSADVSCYCFEAREGIEKAHGPSQSLYSDVCSTLSCEFSSTHAPYFRGQGLWAALVPRGLACVRLQGLHWLSPASSGLAPRTPRQPKSIWPKPCLAKPSQGRIQALVGIQSLG